MIVAYQNQVVMGETLDGALAELFGGTIARRPSLPAVASGAAPATEPSTLDPRLSTLLREAKQHYQAALQAQREIDWARYGEEVRRLGEVLEKLGAGEPER